MPANTQEFNYKLVWNTRKELVLAILFFILSFVIFTMVLIRQIDPVKKVFAELNKTNQELNKFQTKADELAAIAFDSEFKKMNEINEVLPSHKPLLEILNNLNNVALQSETLIENFALSPGEIATDSTLLAKSRKQKNYDELELEFAVSGQLKNVQSFMTLIEQVTPISTITRISLNQEADETGTVKTTANLTLKTFYFTQPISVTITEPLPPIANNQLIILEEIKKLIPSTLPIQDTVVKNNRGNLFGLQGISIEELEQQLSDQEDQNSGEEEDKTEEKTSDN
jgi:hypothetical protein